MSKKRIAILTEWYLPGTKAGGPVRSIYSLVSLLKDQFEFYIVTTNCDLGSDAAYSNVTADQWTKHNGINIFYFSKALLNKESLRKVVNEIEPSVVYLNSFWSYWFSILPLQLKKKNQLIGKIVLAPRGMLSKGALSIKSIKKRSFILFSKLSGLHSGICFHATTSTEEQEIKRFFAKTEIRIASNVNAAIPMEKKPSAKVRNGLKMFYLSRIAVVKNLHFALEVLRDIPATSEILYDIYGSMEDKDYWQQCEAVIRQLPSNIKVNYKGEIGFEAVQQTVKDYDFLFLPTLNENFGHSIVESLASACPVIISDQTPWNGINEAGCGYAISLNEKEKFKTAVIAALEMDNDTHTKMCENCITFIKQKLDLNKVADDYKALFL